MQSILKVLLGLLRESALPIVIEFLETYIVSTIHNPTSVAALRLYAYLKPVQDLVNSLIKKIEDANPQATLSKLLS